MSSRSPEQIAAHALRSGLEVFWPDSNHWAKRAFFTRAVVGGEVSLEKARCVEQMISDSLRVILGDEYSPLRRQVKEIAGQAIVKAALGPSDDRPGMAEPYLVRLNDSEDMTYERMRAYVERAALELESA